jgi:hypothetical protein
MKIHKVKYTIEFEIPEKITDSKLNEKAYENLAALLIQAVKLQIFYFKPPTLPVYHARPKEIKCTREITIENI